MPVRVVSRLVVEWGEDGHTWCPETKELGGVHYCTLQKWDRKFIRFAKDAALDLQKCPDYNIGIVDELCRLRNHACDKALAEMAAESGGGEKKRKSGYQRKANVGDLTFLPSHVEIIMPTITLDDGSSVGGFPVSVLSEGIRSATLFIDMRADVLEYIRHATAHRTTPGRCWKKKIRSNPSIEPDLDLAVESQGLSLTRSRSPAVTGDN